MQVTSYKILDDSCDKILDDFIEFHPEGRFSNLSTYKQVIYKTYNIKTYSIAFFSSNSQIRGVFSAALISGFFSKKKLISMPFTDYGGFLLETGYEIKNEIVKKALDELMLITKADSIEIRGKVNWGGIIDISLFKEVKDCHYSTLSLKDTSSLYDDFDYSIRKNIKRAIANNLTCSNDASQLIIRKYFYPLYLKKMKEFGTPPHSLYFFSNLVEEMKDKIKLFNVLHNNSIVSMLFGIATNNVLQILYIVSQKDIDKIRHDDFIHWEMIKWAAENNRKTFDFGIARYDGQKKYKLKWGTQLNEYSYFFYPKTGSASNMKVFTHKALINKLWSKITPMFITKILGPFIRKKIGR